MVIPLAKAYESFLEKKRIASEIANELWTT